MNEMDSIKSRLASLEKQLNIEMKVKEGAEKMIQMYNSGRLSGERAYYSHSRLWIYITIDF